MEYADKIGISKKLMGLIEDTELRQELLFRFSYYLFFGTAAYLFLKRFYVNELVQILFWFLGKIITTIFDILRYMFSLGPTELFIMIQNKP